MSGPTGVVPPYPYMPRHTTSSAVRNGTCCVVHDALPSSQSGPVISAKLGGSEVPDPVGRGRCAEQDVVATGT